MLKIGAYTYRYQVYVSHQDWRGDERTIWMRALQKVKLNPYSYNTAKRLMRLNGINYWLIAFKITPFFLWTQTGTFKHGIKVPKKAKDTRLKRLLGSTSLTFTCNETR